MAKYYGYCYDKEGRFTEIIPLEEQPVYEQEMIVGYEPIIPANCTLDVCPDLIYHPIFKDGKWIKTVEPKLEEPHEQLSEMEKMKQQLELMQVVLNDLLLEGN